MKNSTLTLFLSVLLLGAMLTNCKSYSVKKDEVQENGNDALNILAEVQNDSLVVQQDTTTAYQKFITESENRINTYEKEIAGLKIKIADEKKTEKAKYEKKLAQLEQKNETLKTKVIDYKDKQFADWDEKQVEFRKDLDDLGSAIADFFVKEE